MKKYLFLTILSLFIQVYSFSQDTESSLLWKIEGNGLSESSFIFGTIHAICPEDLEISPTIESTVEKTKQVVLELDMDDPAFVAQMQRLSFNDSMKNISSLLKPEDLALLDDFLIRNYNTEMAQVGILKPMALMSMVLLKSYHCPVTKSIEEFVVKFAVKNDIPIKGLETVAYQIGIFDEIPQREQINWIISMIKDSVNTKELTKKFSRIYMKGDIEAIHTISQETYPEMLAYEDKLLVDRNNNWVPKMIEFMGQASTFFAVGAGHLGGEVGLIKLLTDKGYRVTPVHLE